MQLLIRMYSLIPRYLFSWHFLLWNTYKARTCDLSELNKPIREAPLDLPSSKEFCCDSNFCRKKRMTCVLLFIFLSHFVYSFSSLTFLLFTRQTGFGVVLVTLSTVVVQGVVRKSCLIMKVIIHSISVAPFETKVTRWFPEHNSIQYKLHKAQYWCKEQKQEI